MKAEIGAGSRAKPGFVSIDLNPAFADIIATATHLPFYTRTIEEMRCVDVLEHISYRDTDRALDEWHRELIPGSPIYIQVPDAGEIMRRYVAHSHELLKTPEGLPDTLLAGAQWRLLGGHADGKYVGAEGDWRWNAHYSLWDRYTLGATLEDRGFTVDRIITNAHPNLCCWARA